MIKLKTLFLLIPFLAFIACSEDESINMPSTSPILASCSLESDVYTQQLSIDGSLEARVSTESKTYTYNDAGEMNSYTFMFRDVYTDTLGRSTTMGELGFQFSFLYSDGLLSSVNLGDEEVISLQNVDGRAHALTIHYADNTDATFTFSYDGNGNVAALTSNDIESGVEYAVTLNYENGILSQVESYYGDDKYDYLEFSFNENVKNPYHGLNFYAVSLIENYLFSSIYGQNVFLLNHTGEFEAFEEYLSGRVILYSRQLDGVYGSNIVYEDQFTYTTNDKGYPVSGGIPPFTQNGIDYNINQQFAYTNCN